MAINQTKRSLLSLVILAALTSLTGCSTAVWYDVIQANTSPDCTKYGNPAERERCQKQTAVSFEEYERERQKAKGK